MKVVAGIVTQGETFLCVQRRENSKSYLSKKWEFPGGKIEPGETAQQALVRELREELEVEAEVGEFLTTVVHQYPNFELTMDCFFCSLGKQEIHLTEHLEARWLRADELASLDWAAADLPVVEKIIQDFSSGEEKS